MIIGALVDLGADADELKSIMEKSAKDFGKVEVSFEKILPFLLSNVNKKAVLSDCFFSLLLFG